MYVQFWKGIHLTDKLTRNPKIWRRYFSWWLHANLKQLPGSEPRWLANVAGWLMPRKVVIQHAGKETTIRQPLTLAEAARSGMPEGWAQLWLFWHHKFRPWFQAKIEPLASSNFHRCDFTDPVSGLLYGGSGTALNEMFAEFLGHIELTEEQKAEAAFAVQDFRHRIEGREDNSSIN